MYNGRAHHTVVRLWRWVYRGCMMNCAIEGGFNELWYIMIQIPNNPLMMIIYICQCVNLLLLVTLAKVFYDNLGNAQKKILILEWGVPIFGLLLSTKYLFIFVFVSQGE